MSSSPASIPALLVLPFVGLLCALVLTQSTYAKAVYHCGSSYQDKPCGNSDKEQKAPIANKTPTKENADKPEIDAQCKQRGEDAKRIIWMRGAGATQDRLLVDAEGDYRKQLIKDVYAQQGNASDVRAAIEKECMSAKEKDTGKTTNAPTPDAKANSASHAEKNISSTDAVCKQLIDFVAGINSVKLSDTTGATTAIVRQQKQQLELQIKNLHCR
ncbi:hypothetical protein ACO0KY_15010 [Undibacterium sp. Dicai25W]|uniref:hypothetical protein n=1 Tax=Undibacterium sp. Dicai25W TaxID=3413034 RepID=UPI003BF34DCF